MVDKPESPLKFPCYFPVKAIGRDADDFEHVVTEIIRRHVPNLRDDAISRRLSTRSNYLSITATIVAQSQDQLDALYRELSAHKQVLVVL